ncbi:UbiD family decarboxylase [Streptomyces sp. NPDC101225]|uniref:UbiD family decarboxylase n=1 Tax=Streptomyces sp. NPDC101225 TaxID=3366135 RepID=UPI0037FFC549
MKKPSLQTFLEADDGVVVIREPVEPVYEIAAYLSLLDQGPAVIFDKVKGSNFRAVGNVLATRESVSRALSVPLDGIEAAVLRAIDTTVDTVEVADAACQQVVMADADLAALPVPTFFEAETGPYITAGVVIARDPLTGAGNASFARLKVLDAKSALIGIAPNHHLWRMAQRSPSGRLDIAVVIGAHPAIQLAACLYLNLGDDELHHAAPLLGRPVEVVGARTVALRVPAEAEFVIEGTFDIHRREAEGLVSEFHGLYEDYGSAPRFEVSCITHRRDALFQVVLPGLHSEHAYLGATAIAAGLHRELARVVPSVTRVAVVEAGGGRLAAVVGLGPGRAGQARRAMMTCWSSVSLVKQVTVVDAHVDPWDAVQVEHARVTLCRADRDIIVVPGMSADRSEPLESEGTVAKIGYDATAKPGDRAEGFAPAAPPSAVLARVRDVLAGKGAAEGGH